MATAPDSGPSDAPDAPDATPAAHRFTPYQKKLLVFLSVATFFEGYDFIALTQILPSLGAEFGLQSAGTGILLGGINLGAILAFAVVRLGDRLGRRRTMMITIAGYTLLTFLSALAPDAITFGAAQLGARVFLLAEYALSMVYAAEEFPASRRGFVIGMIQGFSTLGAIACAGLVPTFLALPWGWRGVYIAGTVPLLLLAWWRRGLRETRRFQGHAAARDRAFADILRGPYRGRVLLMAAIWGLTFMCTQVTVAFWKLFAVEERGLQDAEVARTIVIAAVVSAPAVFAVGRLLDRGRRLSAAILFTCASASTVACYTLDGVWPLTAALTLGIFAQSAVLPLLNTYTAELFPTELRADAYAWANNLLGRIAYVLAPVLVGAVAGTTGYGPAVAATAVFPLCALALVLAKLPETRGRELEETSALDPS
jgi:putative MFS transporter